MISVSGKFLRKHRLLPKQLPRVVLPLSFFLIEVLAFCFLSAPEGQRVLSLSSWTSGKLGADALWPLAFGLLWAVMLTSLLRLLPRKAARIGYGICYFLFLIYALIQTGYFLLFREMIWISDFRYASEGANYLDVLLEYPLSWWISIPVFFALGIVILLRFPAIPTGRKSRIVPSLCAVAAIAAAFFLPQAVFLSDSSIRYAGSDYGRMQSAEAAYENMFSAHRLYQVCGIYQTGVKDLYTNYIYPLSPGYAQAQEKAAENIDAYFDTREETSDNEMTGLLKGKNVILVLMESMDDWMIGEHTPTLEKLMSESISFTRFYTPGYGGVRTFNTEFCINTGSFLSSQGGYAFDYVTNNFDQSLANLLRQEGYSALVYHYNDPSFYSRGVFSEAMGYEQYISYQDYVSADDKDSLYDDQLLFDNQQLSESFFREGPKLNFVITRSAHLSYKYNEVLSYWGLKKYPQYRGLTGSEETDCAYLKARLVDDFFARMLSELEAHGELENTVIVGVTDHYTYGYKNETELLDLSGVSEKLLLERTPCFIWSADLEPMEVDKLLNTSDLLPTLLNLLGVDSPYPYIGQDAFDPDYQGLVPFPDGSWICQDTVWDASSKRFYTLSGGEPDNSTEFRNATNHTVQEFIRINNLMLNTDYYASALEEE